MDIPEIVKKLIGSIEPRGDSQIDEKRYENLIEHSYLVSDLIENLIFVSKYKDSYEGSVSKLGKRAYTELLELRDCLNQIED
jgi:hypothetical protein